MGVGEGECGPEAPIRSMHIAETEGYLAHSMGVIALINALNEST